MCQWENEKWMIKREDNCWGPGERGQNTAYKKEDGTKKTYITDYEFMYSINSHRANMQFVLGTILNTGMYQ